MSSTQRLLQLFLICSMGFTVSGANAAQSDSWSVTDQNEYRVDGKPIALSPDGEWLAGPGEKDDFCIWSVPDLDAFCEETTARPREDTITWSPDSSKVAFGDDPARLFRDSDIMVFDVESKHIDNLTDDPDEIQRPSITSPEPGVTHADTFPLWSADGETLYFLRGDMGGDLQSTKIMALDLESGESATYFTVSPTLLFTVYSPMFELPDGSLLISVINYNGENGQDGIWRISPDGKRIDPVLKSGNDERLQALAVTDVSTDGSTAIVISLAAEGNFNPRAGSPYMLIDLDSGEVTPFPDPDDDADWRTVTPYPLFLGEGTDVVFEVVLEDDDSYGVVVGLDNPTVLIDSLNELDAYGLRANDDGTILVRGADGTVTIFSTEGESPAPCSCTPPPEN